MAAAPAPLKTILHVFDVLADKFQRVQQRGPGDDRRAVLIVVKDRNAHFAPQPLFDDETFRRFDVFQIDAAETRLHQLDGLDEQFRVFGVEFQVNGVQVGEPLEQQGFAFHHGLAGQARRCCPVPARRCRW